MKANEFFDHPRTVPWASETWLAHFIQSPQENVLLNTFILEMCLRLRHTEAIRFYFYPEGAH